MRIVLPVHQSREGGIATVVRTLVEALPNALDPSDELIVIGSEAPPDGGPRNVRYRPSPRPVEGRLGRFVEQQWRVPRAARGADLIHLSDYRPVLAADLPFTVTLHDLTFVDHPEWYPAGVPLYKRALLRATFAKRPAGIICVSEHTRDRLLTLYPAAERFPLRVIHSGIANPPAAGARPADAGSYFLTVSMVEPRKNHLGLLDAYRRAKDRGLDLRWKVAGGPGYRGRALQDVLRREPGVEVLGFVAPAELERLYRGALFVATPSYEEGFGLPTLEAMARGVPTISSRGSAVDETAGGASHRVDPTDTEALAAGLLRLASDSELRATLTAEGRRRAGRFTLEAAARSYAEFLRECASMARPGVTLTAWPPSP